MTRRSTFTVLVCLLLPATLLASGPRPVSPGRTSGGSALSESCPSFSFTTDGEATAYDLAVLALPSDASEGVLGQFTVALRAEIPAGAASWSPSLDECLDPGQAYVWVIRALGDGTAGDWSEPAWFTVPAAPTAREIEMAVDVLRRAGMEASESARDLEPQMSRPAVGSIRGATGDEAPPKRSRVAAAVAAPSDAVGLRSDSSATTGVNFGVLGVVASETAGAAGVVGIASGTAGDNVGVLGQSASSAGTAGHFDNTAGGDILRGLVNGSEVFSVDGTGVVTANAFDGDGSALTGVSSLANGSVAGGAGGVIQDSSITADDIAANAINSTLIKDGEVGTAEIQDGSVTGTDISNGAITGEDMSGTFCVVKKGGTACPAGFSTSLSLTWDTEDTFNADVCSTSIATSCASPGIKMTFCCK